MAEINIELVGTGTRRIFCPLFLPHLLCIRVTDIGFSTMYMGFIFHTGNCHRLQCPTAT